MAKRGKNNRASGEGKHMDATPEKRLASPPQQSPVDSVVLEVFLTHSNSVESAAQPQPAKRQHLSIVLPCTLADVAYQLSEWSFAAVEELAFAAGIEFLPPVKPPKEITFEESLARLDDSYCKDSTCNLNYRHYYHTKACNGCIAQDNDDIPF